jgi:hypothetical protein
VALPLLQPIDRAIELFGGAAAASTSSAPPARPCQQPPASSPHALVAVELGKTTRASQAEQPNRKAASQRRVVAIQSSANIRRETTEQNPAARTVT